LDAVALAIEHQAIAGMPLQLNLLPWAQTLWQRAQAHFGLNARTVWRFCLQHTVRAVVLDAKQSGLTRNKPAVRQGRMQSLD
jgi:hypothetical protein